MTLLLRLRQRLTQGIRHRVTLLGAMILSLLLASGLLAFTTSQNAFFLLFSLLLGSVLLSSFINRLMLAGLRAELELPPHAMANSDIEANLVLRNDKYLLPSFALTVKPEVGKPLHIPAIPARDSIREKFICRWPTRGWQNPVSMEIETRFPFGYSIRRTRVRVPVSAPLYPSILARPGFPQVLAALLQYHRAENLTGSEDFSHLRSYAPGDPARQIAWTASARVPNSQPPLVRVLSGESGGRLRLALDLGSPRLETVIALAAYLVWECQYRNLEFVFSSGKEELQVRSAHDAYTLLRYLALVSAEPSMHVPHESSAFLLSLRAGTACAHLDPNLWSEQPSR